LSANALTPLEKGVRFMSMRWMHLLLLVMFVGGTLSPVCAREAVTKQSNWTKIKEIFK